MPLEFTCIPRVFRLPKFRQTQLALVNAHRVRYGIDHPQRIDNPLQYEPSMSSTVKKREPRSPEAPAPDPGGTSFMTDRFLPYLVTQTSNVWNKKFKEDLRRTEVNAKQWSVLANIWRRQEVSPTELAKVTGIDQPTISRMIDQLESRALVRRQVDENNGRYVRLAITPKG